MKKDLEDLRILKTLYYVYGGISLAVYILPSLLLPVGIGLLIGASESDYPEKNKETAGILIFIGAAFLIYGVGTSIATILVGKYIKERRKHLFCLVLAGFNCLFFPLGTGLGVYTFVVLLRDSVKEMFRK